MTLEELAESMRALALDYRQKADALDRAVAALEGEAAPTVEPAPVPRRAGYAPVGAPDPTLDCPLSTCDFVARGEGGLSVHLSRIHGYSGAGNAKRRQRLALIEQAKRGEKVAPEPAAVPADAREGVERFIPAPEPEPQEPTPEPAVTTSLLARAKELAAQPAGEPTPFTRRPFDPDEVRRRAAEGM